MTDQIVEDISTMILRATFHRSRPWLYSRTIVASTMLTIISGCQSIIPGTSPQSAAYSHTAVGAIPVGMKVEGFRHSHHHVITFDRDLFGSVNVIFARLNNDDTNTQKLIDEFMQPALDLLLERYGITLKEKSPVAYPELSEFRFKSHSDYVTGTIVDQSVPQPVLWLAHSTDATAYYEAYPPDAAVNYRWRAENISGIASFNSQTPRDVTISIEIHIELQKRTIEDPAWMPVFTNYTQHEHEGRELIRELNKRYRDYVWSRYRLKVTSISQPKPE